ncbi:MAG: hypothetical protein RLZ22_161 [Verrucomicrobiota bacterium]|jgi:hypothetical protein
MSAIIYEKTANGLYPTGQRTVATFPSGLLRVEQTFACKTTSAPTHRASLAVGSDFPSGSYASNEWLGYPSYDGFKIFPEVQEIQRNDGFTEFKASGYGRTSEDGSFSFLTDYIYSKSFWNGTDLIDYLLRTKPILVKKVFVSSQGYDIENDFSNLSDPTMYFENQTMPSGWTFENYPGTPEIQNYGYFSEVTVRITRM